MSPENPAQREGLKPTAKQLEFAKSLGVAVPDRASRSDVGELIDEAIDRRRVSAGPALHDATPGQMAEELFRRGLAAAVIYWPIGTSAGCSTSFDDRVGQAEVEKMIVVYGAHLANAQLAKVDRLMRQ